MEIKSRTIRWFCFLIPAANYQYLNSMKRILFLTFVILVSCTSKEERMKEAKKEILNADRSFSMMSMNEGMHQAFLSFASNDVIKLRDGKPPIMNKSELEMSFREQNDSLIKLHWEPIVAEVSESGDLGYTFGNWELYIYGRRDIQYGNYVTIWKKQTDGTWKYVLDAGAKTPKPF